MGELIYLHQRRADRIRSGQSGKPAFFFDLACPLSYLAAERIERTLGDVEWVPVARATLRPDAGESEFNALCERAESHASALRLPLVWPERFPAAAPRALRAAAHACAVGAGARFVLAASRLAFCGGFDLEDPETLAEAAAAADVPLDDCLAAAAGSEHDADLRATADGLRAHGVNELPAIRVGRSWFSGPERLPAARALMQSSGALAQPLAPVG
jgi:2-hydroxychromene-2-carboxylate isomerase